jgi:hypothetical protein
VFCEHGSKHAWDNVSERVLFRLLRTLQSAIPDISDLTTPGFGIVC